MKKNELFSKFIQFFIVLCSAVMLPKYDCVTVAILAKDKAHTLPLYLKCIEHQTWPKKKTNLYIRTNNNNDNTLEVLQSWLKEVGNQYAEIYFDATDVPQEIQKYRQHEWNCERFKILGKIRQDSIIWAYEHNSHYFVVDCDNFIKPHTLEAMMKLDLAIVAPFIYIPGIYYANYHAAIDVNGYLAESAYYNMIFDQSVKGLIQVPVVHCCYFIQHKYLPYMSYDDDSYRYEYVIFSDVARKKNIPQYLDNREHYGFITFAETTEDLNTLWWLNQVSDWCNK
jgi:hypothetical protein